MSYDACETCHGYGTLKDDSACAACGGTGEQKPVAFTPKPDGFAQRLNAQRVSGKTPERPRWNRAQRRAFARTLPRETRAAIKRGEIEL
jgi:hypothetical protein